VGRAAREALLTDHETAVGYIVDGTQSLVFIVMTAAVNAARPPKGQHAMSWQSLPNHSRCLPGGTNDIIDGRTGGGDSGGRGGINHYTVQDASQSLHSQSNTLNP
jgi:hypothetical protein